MIWLRLDHIAQEDRFAAIRTEHLPLAAGSQRLGDLRLVAKSLSEGVALLVSAEIAPQPRHVLRVLHEVIMHVTQEQHTGVSVHVRFKIDLQPRTALGFPRQRESQFRSGLRLEIRRRLPELRALKRHRVMQPHHQRRVDVVRRT
ncbi:MAG: hypothetical protein AAB466_02860, partial [Verrucomicrobiota bacterium]